MIPIYEIQFVPRHWKYISCINFCDWQCLVFRNFLNVTRDTESDAIGDRSQIK